MTFSLKTLLIQSMLLTVAVSWVLLHGNSIVAHISVAILYSLVFSLWAKRDSAPVISMASGMWGAVVGWALAIAITVLAEVVYYFVATFTESQPGLPFDGDGFWMGAIVLPLFAFLFFVIPMLLMGLCVGMVAGYLRKYLLGKLGQPISAD